MTYRYETRLTEHAANIVEHKVNSDGRYLGAKWLQIVDEAEDGRKLSIRIMEEVHDPYDIRSSGILVPRDLARRAFYWAARAS